MSIMGRGADVLVIGGGVIGVCAAYYLAQSGRSVTLVERDEICAGASYGNAGLLVPSHAVPLAAPGVVSKGIKWMFNSASPFYIKPRLDLNLLSWLWKFRGACTKGHVRRAAPLIRDLSLASLDLYDELAVLDGLEFGFRRKGLLALCNSNEGLDELGKEVEVLRGIDLDAELLTPAEAAEREPDVQLDIVGAAYYAQDAHLTPDLFVKGLAEHLAANGMEVVSHAEVIDVAVEHGHVNTVCTTRGDFAPREVVLSAGSWSPEIGRRLGLRLPIQPAKGYHVTFKKPAVGPSTPMILCEAKVGVGPMVGKLRFAGTLELGGLDMGINRRRVNAILGAIPTYLPQLDPNEMELMEIWRGLRPCSPDGLPFIGRPCNLVNLVVAAGHATIGVSLGPITGKLVAEIIEGTDPSIDLSALAVDRFN